MIAAALPSSSTSSRVRTRSHQPIISLVTGSIKDFEALARRHHRERGHISPADLFPTAEVTGLIRQLGKLVRAHARGFYFSRPISISACDSLIVTLPWKEDALLTLETSSELRVDGSAGTYHRCPLANVPPFHESIHHVRIGLRELCRGGWRFAVEQNGRAVDRVREGSAKHEIAARGCRAGVFEVRRAKRLAPLFVTRHDFIEQQEVLHGSSIASNENRLLSTFTFYFLYALYPRPAVAAGDV